MLENLHKKDETWDYQRKYQSIPLHEQLLLKRLTANPKWLKRRKKSLLTFFSAFLPLLPDYLIHAKEAEMRKRHANLKDHILRKVGVELGEGITLLRALPLASLVGQKAYPENSKYILQGVPTFFSTWRAKRANIWFHLNLNFRAKIKHHEWRTSWPEMCVLLDISFIGFSGLWSGLWQVSDPLNVNVEGLIDLVVVKVVIHSPQVVIREVLWMQMDYLGTNNPKITLLLDDW